MTTVEVGSAEEHLQNHLIYTSSSVLTMKSGLYAACTCCRNVYTCRSSADSWDKEAKQPNIALATRWHKKTCIVLVRIRSCQGRRYIVLIGFVPDKSSMQEVFRVGQ